jgi:hypothetical protein
MKKGVIGSVTIILLAGFAILMGGCASTHIRHLSGDAFLEQAKQTEQLGSFQWTSYIGKGGDRVYLEYGHPAFIGDGQRVTVYWTTVAELPEELAAQLRNSQRPWKNVLQERGAPSSETDR